MTMMSLILELVMANPSLVANNLAAKPAVQPWELTREVLSKLKFHKTKYWLCKYHIPLSNRKQAIINNLVFYLDSKDLENISVHNNI